MELPSHSAVGPERTALDGIRRELGVIVKAVSSTALETGGKKNPAKNGKPSIKPEKCGCKSAGVECECEDEIVQKFVVEIAKAEKRIVTGVVLKPETTDAQSDIYDAGVIEKAAYDFLARFGKQTKLGLQHNSFKAKENRFELAESYIAPMDFVLGTKVVKSGSWVMSVRVLDEKLWKAVKEGKITGFSVGGRAKAEQLTPQG